MVPLAEGPEEPVVGGADSDSGLQQEANRLLHLGDDQVHRRRHVHELVFGRVRETEQGWGRRRYLSVQTSRKFW